MATKKSAKVPQLPISDRNMASIVQVFKLLADDSRLRIMLTLSREGEMHVTALCEMLDQSQPAVSHHLTLLRMAGLVGFRRDGKFNFYYMDGMHLGTVLDSLFADLGKASKLDFGDFSLTYARAGKKR